MRHLLATSQTMKLILFGTSACHLCEQAETLLQQIVTHYPQVDLEQIDIAEQPQWQEHYAIRIPVLLHPASLQELGWFFNQTDIINFINKLDHD
jgi:hypothetical protein